MCLKRSSMENKNLNRGSISDLDEESRFITQAIDSFAKLLVGYHVELDNTEHQKIIADVNQHYKKHREAYKRICYIKNGDIFKIISWTAMFLYQNNRDKRILKAACTYMNAQLKKIGRTIPDKTIIEIVEMLCNDGKDDTIAVGKNGLYIAFKCASEAGRRDDAYHTTHIKWL